MIFYTIYITHREETFTQFRHQLFEKCKDKRDAKEKINKNKNRERGKKRGVS